MNILSIGTLRILEVDGAGPPLGSERSALDLMGETYGQDVDMIVVPLARLDPDFLVLRTGMAGSFIQKFVNYGHRLAIVGDISAATERSQPLRDFVAESNRHGGNLFVRDMGELERALTKQ